MFAREQRLTDKKLFATLFRRGSWVRGRYFSLILLPTHHDGKIGFVITKKVLKSAAARNRTKRRIRAIFQSVLQSSRAVFLEKNNIAVMIHKPVDDLTPIALQHEVDYLFQKLDHGRIQGPKKNA